MTTKRKSILSFVTSIALAMILCLGMVMPAMAADAIYSQGTDSEHPAHAAITKVFKMPTNTTVPEAKFVFKFEKVGMNDPLVSTDAIKDKMPGINDVTINYTVGENPSAPKGGTFIDGDTKYAVKESNDFLAGMIGSTYWENGEGVYKYTVYEYYAETDPDNSSNIKITDATKEEAFYSEAVYDVEIWVEKDKDGVLFPKYVAVKIKPGSVDEHYWIDGEPGDEAEKVDPRPGGPGYKPGEDPSIDNAFSQVIFTNKYWKNIGGGEKDPTVTALEIVKKVTGNGSSIEDYFAFTVTVIKPSMIKDTGPYMAYILDENDDIIKIDADNYAGTIKQDKDDNDYIEFYSDAALTVNLKHGQRLAFVDLYVGTLVKAEEAGNTKYTPKYERTFAKVKDVDEFLGKAGESWGFPLNANDKGPHYIEDGLNFNIALFTNTRTGATPMGISVDNLPYVILIGVGLCALVGFIAFTVRKKTKYDAQV